METAIVTGASSGIGRAVADFLLKRRIRVFGLARRFEAVAPDEGVTPIPCDVTDLPRLKAVAEAICREAGGLDILVNCAGVGTFGPHETLSPEQIETMVTTNLTAPLVLTGAVLRHLRARRGRVINIASTAAVHPHRLGCAYAATKAGLLRFGEALFEETRKGGVGVTTLLPDMVPTPFYAAADFAPASDPDCHITPACVVDAIRLVLDAREGTVPAQITLYPQRVGIRRK